MAVNFPGNYVAIKFTVDELQRLQDAAQVYVDILGPKIEDLTADQRRTMDKMTVKDADFVAKGHGYAVANPQFVPPFLDVEDYGANVAAIATLRGLQQPLNLIAKLIEDGVMRSGNAARAATLAFYNGAQQAARLKLPGAQLIVDDMGTRFAVRSPKAAGDAPGAAKARAKRGARARKIDVDANELDADASQVGGDVQEGGRRGK